MKSEHEMEPRGTRASQRPRTTDMGQAGLSRIRGIVRRRREAERKLAQHLLEARHHRPSRGDAA